MTHNPPEALSLSDVEQALEQFLNDPSPSIIAMTGQWGRGKSYFWRAFLGTHVSDIDTRLYSYISLFGLGDLQQLKDAVFDNAVPLRPSTPGELAPNPFLSVQGLKERTSALVWHARKLGRYADTVPKLADLAPFAKSIAFLSVKDYVICIDDLERRGAGLALRDVFGLATLLHEQRGCRVIVILNSDALGSDRTEYDQLREKVFDYEIAFEPAAGECARIAFPESDGPYAQAREFSIALGITNIRVLFRIRRLLMALLAEATDAPNPIKRQLVHSGVLLGWSYNTKDGSAPEYEYVKAWNYGRLVDRAFGKEPTAEQKNWTLVLEKYNYGNTDELDLAICDTLERGFADTRQLKHILINREEAKKRSEIEKAFHDAWAIFREGFGEDEGRLASAFRASFEKGAHLISLANASATTKLLRELGNHELADALMGQWIDRNQQVNPEALNVDRGGWREEIRDPVFLDAASKAYATVRPAPPLLADVAFALASKNGWNEEEVDTLANASVEDFYRFFKSLSGPDTRAVVRACWRFRDFGPEPKYKAIAANVQVALERIAGETALNADRVRAMGISIDSVPAASGDGNGK